MLKALATPVDRTRTIVFLSASAALAVAAVAVGIDDNPPGLALAFLSGAALTLAFSHPWRTARRYRQLIYAAALGFVLSALLHNLCWALSTVPDLPGLAAGVLTGLSVAFFFTGILLFPPALVVGVVGALVMAVRHRVSE